MSSLKIKKINAQGTTMIELVLAITIMGIVLLGIISFVKGVVVSYQRDRNRITANKLAVETMNYITSFPWDECLATNPTLTYAAVAGVSCSQRIGFDTGALPNTADDVVSPDDIDDFNFVATNPNSYQMVSGRFTTTAVIRYVNMTMAGNVTLMGNGTGSGGPNAKTDFKRIIVTSRWNEFGQAQNLSLTTVVANGRLEGIR